MTQVDPLGRPLGDDGDDGDDGLDHGGDDLLAAMRRGPGADWQHDPWDDPRNINSLHVERRRHAFRPFKTIVYLMGVLGIVAIVVVGAFGFWYVREVNPPGDPGAPVNFTVRADDTLVTVSERLEAAGLVSDAGVFRSYVERQGGLELIPGYFQVRPSDHMGNVMRILSTPPSETYTKVTFPEGFTMEKMANRLKEKMPRLSREKFLAAASDGSIHSTFQPEGYESLEGLLFPDTYQVSNGETEAQVVKRMVDLMQRVGEQEHIVELGAAQGLTPYQVITIASIVEREAKTEEDRPLIARVILNRLRAGIPLQVDATLYYGQDPSRPFSELKALDTPFNTYLHLGLPPTPISNPGRASIQAVLNPAPDPPTGGALCRDVPVASCHYFFYVLASEDGSHAFAVTLGQHEANVEKARQAGLL